MLLANFNGKEHLRHRAVSLRQHGFLVLWYTRVTDRQTVCRAIAYTYYSIYGAARNKMSQIPTCDLQPRLSELFKRTVSKTSAPSSGKISVTVPDFLAVMQYDTWSTINVSKGKLWNGAAFLSYSYKRFSKKQTDVAKVTTGRRECSISCVIWLSQITGIWWLPGITECWVLTLL